jgi:hypothetical protein
MLARAGKLVNNAPCMEGDSLELDEIRAGGHVIRFEPPDLIYAILDGDVSGTDVVTSMEAVNRFAEGKRWVLCIADMTRAASLMRAARRLAMSLTPVYLGTAIIGASPQMRLVGSMLNRARNVLLRGREIPIEFVDTEEEARAWVAVRRLELAAEEAP